ncbi:MAG TPA: penicillin-binding protein 2 [Gaiellaceae bacterium]|nr:penicillin-binding protein 2 [Gaiellaceae bacterium]
MNPQIRRLFYVFTFLFVALIATATYWLWRAPDLEARQGNPGLVVRELEIRRGLVYASDGRTVLARNRRRELEDGRVWWLRRYPRGELAAHAVGYSTVARSRTGLEESLNDFLTGSNANLSTIIDATLDRLRGLTREGNDVITTLDLRAQETAMQALASSCGAAVALEPATGRVLALASTPSFDPNLVEDDFRQIERIEGACTPAAPLLDRATAGLFTPGSTFKVVTAAAALDTGTFRPTSEFDDPGYCVEYGQRVFNYSDQGTPSGFGRVTLAQAVENSINSVFCNIGKELGADVVLDYAERFGFYDRPPLELPSDEVAISGLYREGRLYRPDDPNQVDPGRLAFGQERLLATPLQMALVAAGVANDGVVMEPTLVDRILAPDGDVVERFGASEWKEAIKPSTAAELTAMMTAVVASGTATSAQIPGVEVAGKTGTAETGVAGRNNTWFIAFAPARSPEVAVAVTLTDQAGTGGSTAAPIAKAIMEAVLSRNT